MRFRDSLPPHPPFSSDPEDSDTSPVRQLLAIINGGNIESESCPKSNTSSTLQHEYCSHESEMRNTDEIL